MIDKAKFRASLSVGVFLLGIAALGIVYAYDKEVKTDPRLEVAAVAGVVAGAAVLKKHRKKKKSKN